MDNVSIGRTVNGLSRVGCVLLVTSLVACGQKIVPHVVDADFHDASDIDAHLDAYNDADSSAADGGQSGDAADDGAPDDGNTVEDSGTQSDAGAPDAEVPDSGTVPDASEPDAGAPDSSMPDASTPSAYHIEIWGFTVPAMRRRVQVAAPGYTNWQTHDPEAGVVSRRAADVSVAVNTDAPSVVFNNTHTASGTTAPLYVSPDLDFEDLADAYVSFGDYEQNGDFSPEPSMPYEGMGSPCLAGWVTAAAVSNSLATGNIQTTACPSPTHPTAGVTMFNADFIVEWRVVAVP